MRNLLILSFPPNTGIGKVPRLYAKYLLLRGDFVDVLYLLSDDKFVVADDLSLPIFAKFRSSSFTKGFVFGEFGKFLKSVAPVIERFYDRVIFDSPLMARFGALFKRLPYSIFVHDLFPFVFRLENLFSPGNLFLALVFVFFRSSFRRVIFNSRATQKDFEKYLGYPYSEPPIIFDNLLPYLNGTTVPYDYNGLFSTPFVISVSSEQPRKNIRTFLSLARLCKLANSKLFFVRVGCASFFSRLFIRLYKLSNVIYISGLSEEELNYLYSKSLALIVTSLEEGMCLPPFEAWLQGTNVIYTDVADLKILLKDYPKAFMVENPKNVQQYKFIIEKLLKNDCS